MPETTRTDRTAGEIDWPDGIERRVAAERHHTSKFDVTLNRAIKDLKDELEERLEVVSWQLSTAAPHRKGDGYPYANASPDDPAVVVRWSMDVEDQDHPAEFEVVCDKWTKLRDNMRELGLWFEEKRKMEGRPVTTRRSEFASARKELPPGERDDAMVAESGRPSLSEDEAADLLGVHPDSPERVIKTAFQEAVKTEHPDQGGNGEPVRLKAARNKLLEE